MKHCWSFDPEKRPSFSMCLQRLEKLAADGKYATSPLQPNIVHNQAYEFRNPAAKSSYILSRKSCCYVICPFRSSDVFVTVVRFVYICLSSRKRLPLSSAPQIIASHAHLYVTFKNTVSQMNVFFVAPFLFSCFFTMHPIDVTNTHSPTLT